MANLSIAQLVALAQSAGFADPATAAAIAMAESGGNPAIVNDTRGRADLPAGTQPEYSIGLWQINVLAHPQYDPTQLTDPQTNANAALAISSGGTTFTPWSTYTTSNPALSYSRFLPAAQAAGGTATSMPLLLRLGVILAAGAGAAWLIEHGALEDVGMALRGLGRRLRAMV